ncbi:MAG: DUF4926 domain-containing protein [Nitrospira sp.]|nr:DUF4926 domain-containing protein [Nitrospira sp.]
MISELETVVLRRDFQEFGLKHGDIGTVVHCYADGATFEVEFVTADGKTIALLTLKQTDIRPMNNKEILHAREFAPTSV